QLYHRVAVGPLEGEETSGVGLVDVEVVHDLLAVDQDAQVVALGNHLLSEPGVRLDQRLVQPLQPRSPAPVEQGQAAGPEVGKLPAGAVDRGPIADRGALSELGPEALGAAAAVVDHGFHTEVEVLVAAVLAEQVADRTGADDDAVLDLPAR